MAERLAISNLNNHTREEFIHLVGPVFEHSPWIAERTWEARPFGTMEDLHARLCATVKASTIEEQLGLIRAHPDLVGRAALAWDVDPGIDDSSRLVRD